MSMAYGREPLKKLYGIRLRIYLILLQSNEPLSVKEVQKLMGMRSPGSVKYHLEKLVIDGLAERLSLIHI